MTGYYLMDLYGDAIRQKALTGHFTANGLGSDELGVDGGLDGAELAADDQFDLDGQVLGQEGGRAPDDAPADDSGQLLQFGLAEFLGVVRCVGVPAAQNRRLEAPLEFLPMWGQPGARFRFFIDKL